MRWKSVEWKKMGVGIMMAGAALFAQPPDGIEPSRPRPTTPVVTEVSPPATSAAEPSEDAQPETPPAAQNAPKTEIPAPPAASLGKLAEPESKAKRHSELRRKAEALHDLLGPSEEEVAKSVQAGLLYTEDVLDFLGREEATHNFCFELGYYLGKVDRSPVDWEIAGGKIRVLKETPDARTRADLMLVTTNRLQEALTGLHAQCRPGPYSASRDERASLRKRLLAILRLQLSLYRQVTSEAQADGFIKGLVEAKELTDAEAETLRRGIPIGESR